MATATVPHWQPTDQQRSVVTDAGAAYGLSSVEVTARRKHGIRPRARHAAVWALKARWPSLSWPQIAVLMGGWDHSSAIYAHRNAAKLREIDPQFREITDALAGSLPVPIVRAPEALVLRLTQGVPMSSEFKARKVRARNNFGDDTWKAEDLIVASKRLLVALRREHPERCAA